MGKAVRRVLVGVPLAFVALVAVEIVLAARADYLPDEPGFVVDEVVGSGDGPRVELVMMGDSTVAGVGSSTERTSLAVQTGARVADALDRSVHVVGLGVSGARTASLVPTQVRAAAERPVDVLVIVIGSNDVTHVTPPWSMDDRTRALLRAAQEAVAPAPVVLGGIPQFKTVPALAQPLRWLTGRYATLLRGQQRAAADAVGVSYVDIAALASPRFVGVPEAMSANGFHPADVGYGFWADALAPAIVEVLREGP